MLEQCSVYDALSIELLSNSNSSASPMSASSSTSDSDIINNKIPISNNINNNNNNINSKNVQKNQDLLSVISWLEKNQVDKPMTIFTIGHNSNVSSKRLYEMMNVACVIGACKRCDGSLYSWQGLGKINHQLVELYKETEREGENMDIVSMFAVKTSPSIEELTAKFIKLYFYLGKQSIEIRDAVVLFAANGSKSQTILRRLYCIANVLATFRVIDHPHHRAEFIINIDLEKLSNFYYSKQSADNISNTDPIRMCTMLSRVNMGDVALVQGIRRNIFANFLKIAEKSLACTPKLSEILLE